METKTTFNGALDAIRSNRGMAFGAIIVTALLAFEIFNYGTTDFALTDLLGDLKFAGIRWATILAIAFCGIDFAGIARLFSPEMTKSHNENWFLFGAWLLAATMNAMLTWWGVSLAIMGQETAGGSVIAHETMLRVGPIFVSVLVWLIRVLIIGTFAAAGDRLFGGAGGQQSQAKPIYRPIARPASSTQSVRPAQFAQPAPERSTQHSTSRPEQPAQGQPSARPSSQRSQPGRPANQPIPHSFSNTPRRYTPPPPEPEYSDEDESIEIIDSREPQYSNAPLAAKSANRPSGSPSSEPGQKRSSGPQRRF